MSFARRAYLNLTDETENAKAIMQRLQFVVNSGVKGKANITVTNDLTPLEKQYFEFGGHGEMPGGAIKISRTGKQSWEERDFYILEKIKGLEVYPVFRLIAKGTDNGREELATKDMVSFDSGKLAGIYDITIGKDDKQAVYVQDSFYKHIDFENVNAMLETLDKYYGRHLEGYAQEFGLATREIPGR